MEPDKAKILAIYDRLLAELDTEEKLRAYLDNILMRSKGKTTAALEDNSYDGLKAFLCGTIVMTFLNGMLDEP